MGFTKVRALSLQLWKYFLQSKCFKGHSDFLNLVGKYGCDEQILGCKALILDLAFVSAIT